ncbi:MAG: class I SAM-dependent RNA methyltransferase [Paracoccaceae bacterium]|nr:class I SAM-dependent RNA methyltransferase [Paracoccaceae bacterium]
MKLTIERLGHLGDGIAPGPIFVPRTLPGEVVEGELDGSTLAAPRILEPSADRVKAPCTHYGQCGGCALQHASDGFVAAWKQEVVQTALAAQGISTLFRPISTSPALSRRRAVLAGRRTKKGVIVGFHGRASGTVVPVPGCRLLRPEILGCLPALEAMVTAGGSRKGELAMTVTVSDAGADVLVTGGKPLEGELRATLAGIAETHGLARLTWGDEVVALRLPPTQSFGPARVVPPPGAFLQATAEGEAALLAAVIEAVGPARRIVDLFAGAGTFALPLAATAEVHAVEGDAAMVKALDRGWREAEGLKRVTAESRDLFRRPLHATEFKGIDAVVIDPPRAGAEAQVAELARAGVPVIAMISCNPVTFARDAKALVEAGYRVDWVQVVDQFRWSTHVEMAARLSRDI